MTTDANALLMGSGAPAAKFDHIGASISGVVAREPEAKPQTDFRTGTPEVWPDGSAKMQILIQLQTSERDPSRPNDDGTRTVYVKGKYLTDAIRQAVRQAGADGVHTGGILTVTYTQDGPAKPGLSAPKLYAAQYTPPATSFAGVAGPAADDPWSAPAAQTATTSVLGTPAAAIPPAPVGIDAATWAAMAPDQRQRVLAALAPTAATPPF